MITTKQYAVLQILGSEFFYVIPPYQRPYAWTTEEALQLFDDVVDAAKRDSGEPYFLGSIVLVGTDDQISRDVVDGQQRLMSLTILCAVLRDIASDDKERSALAKAVYIEPNPFEGQVEATRVKAHKEDEAFFRDAVQLPGATAAEKSPEVKTDSQNLIWQNVKAFREKAVKLEDPVRQNLVGFLLTKCIVVAVITASRSNALRIFRVLNDRGLNLSNADVIKADLLDKLAEFDVPRYAAKWRESEIDLGRDDFETLLENLRFMWEHDKNRRALSEAYQERFRHVEPDIVKVFFKEELAPAKFHFAEITTGDGSFFDPAARQDAIELLAGLRLVPNKDWMPLALAIVMRMGGSAAAAHALSQLEGLAWVMQLDRRYDTQRMGRYAEALKCLGEGNESLTDSLRPTNAERKAAREALNGPLYDMFPVRVVRAILERLDRLLAEQPVHWTGQKTVEHILPQKPAPGAWGEFPEGQRSAVVHLLGNLVLLTRRKNSEASNLDYLQKRTAYFGLAAEGITSKLPTYASIQELAHVPAWTPAVLKSRHDRHVKLLASRWCIDEG